MRHWLAVLVALVLVAPASSAADSYSTNCTPAQDPWRDTAGGGNWLEWRADGIDWLDITTVPGYCSLTAGNPNSYNDTTGVVGGLWGPVQAVSAVVFYSRGNADNDGHGFAQETELRLLTTISPHFITGYEVQCGQIVRWNGVIGDFTVLPTLGGDGIGPQSGDILSADVDASGVISMYRNGTLCQRAQDTVIRSGAPGLGLFTRNPKPPLFGFTSFSASDNGTLPPLPSPSPGNHGHHK